jgi:hypothetical protein
MKRIAIFGVCLSMGIVFSPSSNAAIKAGSSCTKVNQTSGSGATKMTCKTVKQKLVWVKTPSSNPLGTISNPVPMASSLAVGDFTYRIDSIEFGLDEEICASNSFNGGCTFDDNFDAIVDPNSKFNWAAVKVTAANKSAVIAKPAALFMKTFSLVLPSGQLLGSEIFAVGDEDFSQLQIIPGGSGSGRIFFQIPKTIKTLKSLLVIRDSSSFLKTKDFYFTLEW